MNKALEIFTAIPKKHNCAQAVACGCGHEELYAELASCGGGRAPEGRCGALHAALMLARPEDRAEMTRIFIEELGSDKCRELKAKLAVPCTDCVGLAAELVEKFVK